MLALTHILLLLMAAVEGTEGRHGGAAVVSIGIVLQFIIDGCGYVGAGGHLDILDIVGCVNLSLCLVLLVGSGVLLKRRWCCLRLQLS